MSKKMGVAIYAERGYRILEVLDDTPGSNEVIGFAIAAPDSDPLLLYKDESAAVQALKLMLWRPELEAPAV